MKIKEINILGEKYTIDESEELENKDGQCDWTTKEIKICNTLLIGGEGKLKNLELYKNSVIRHEIIHAILHESGIDTINHIHNEETIDWIARIFPKMLKIFKELDVEN